MKRKYLITSIVCFTLFIILAILLIFVDKTPIGPNNSSVGLSKLNGWVSELIGVNFTLYNITDWGGILPILTAICYAILGLIQWIKRKSIKNVDKSILVLGIFYLLIFGIYMIFNYVVINYRPVLINGYLEPSFPSSTTLMSITFMMLSIYQTNRLIHNKKLQSFIKLISIAVMLFLVIGRIISGVHWITDIIASIVLSIAIVNLYYFICSILTNATTVKTLEKPKQ